MANWGVYILIIGGGLLVFYLILDSRRSGRGFILKPNDGTSAEVDLISKLFDLDVPSKAIFHDLYLSTHRNFYSQIDIVVPTKVGIVVFEVKDYSGWLFGKGYQRKWTQVLDYGRQKYRFYNPILQNKTHINQLKKHLPREDVPYFSVIVFYGDCELREVSHIPKDVYLTKPYAAHIAFETILNEHPPAVYIDKHNIIKVLKEAVANGQNPAIREQHAQNVRNAFGKARVFD